MQSPFSKPVASHDDRPGKIEQNEPADGHRHGSAGDGDGLAAFAWKAAPTRSAAILGSKRNMAPSSISLRLSADAQLESTQSVVALAPAGRRAPGSGLCGQADAFCGLTACVACLISCIDLAAQSAT